ncbi:hypothetical protein ACTXT7_004154 [Hymenolepis weldensis]
MEFPQWETRVLPPSILAKLNQCGSPFRPLGVHGGKEPMISDATDEHVDQCATDAQICVPLFLSATGTSTKINKDFKYPISEYAKP